jgi:hypothetical protein
MIINKIEHEFITYLQDEWNYDYYVHLPLYGTTKETLIFLLTHAIFFPQVSNDHADLTFNSFLLKLTYKFMKDTDRSFIYIIEDTEGNWSEREHHVKIHRMCSQAGVPEDRIVYLNNDISLNERYDVWFDKQSEYKTKINMISYPFLLQQFAVEYLNNDIKHQNTKLDDGYLNTYEIVRYKDREKLPTKKFMCLMGRGQWFRENLWKYIDWNEDLKNSIYVSFIERNILLEKRIEPILRSRIMNGESEPKLDIQLGKYYKDSYVSIIPETSCGLYASEKTTKVLYHGHPFIMFNPATDMTVKKIGVLDKLRDWGFETFPELFDESYDDLPIFEPEGVFEKRVVYYQNMMGDDVEIRWKAFTKNIERLLYMDKGEFHKLCESVEEKCIHNRKTLMNLKIPTEELLSKLKNIVERLK